MEKDVAEVDWIRTLRLFFFPSVRTPPTGPSHLTKRIGGEVLWTFESAMNV